MTAKLDQKHIAKVVSMSTAFKNYVTEMYHNRTAAERAHALELRALSDFEPERSLAGRSAGPVPRSQGTFG